MKTRTPVLRSANRKFRYLILVFGLGTLIGCVRAPQSAVFDDVNTVVESRIGQEVRYLPEIDRSPEIDAIIVEVLSRELDVGGAVRIALVNNRNLQARYEELGISRADLLQSGIPTNPALGGSYESLRDGPGSEFEFELIFEFIDLITLPARKSIAKDEYEATKLRVAATVVDLVAEVRARFRILQGDVQMAEMMEQVVRSTSASLELSEKLREAGNITVLDVASEGALNAEALLDLASSEARVSVSRESLNSILGLWGAQTSYEVAPRLPVPPDVAMDVSDIERRAIEASLDLDEADLRISAAAKALSLTKKTAWFPRIGLGVSGTREPEGDKLLGIGFDLPIPIFDRGKNRIARSEALLRQRQQDHYALAVEIRSSARAARDRLVASRSKALYYRDVVLPLREQVVHESQLHYNAMQFGLFRLLDAKRDEINAGRAYVEALREYSLRLIEMETLLSGRLTTADGAASNANTESMPAATGGEGGH